ncbi:hypothetical protein [Francisella sp. SYW-9]|uniref:hypothetical protein n=1 Tax=Francisella sp. SYW-9 TaxID=2610888 RepID=UPI00123CFFEB|nr:hypothetical protein [Francisella sp. SYW-9]
MIELTNKLLEWNRKYLTYNSDLSIEKISQVFADRFDVFANSRSYFNVDHQAYLEFLQGFRATIKDIDYVVKDTIVDDKSVVLPMLVKVTRADGSVDTFEAILWLKYNSENKIVLWHEVYVKTNNL